MRTRLVKLCLLAALALAVFAIPTVVEAQHGFRVTHTVSRTTPNHVEVGGTVYNESRAEALDVSVTVEALGPAGKVAARGITYVTGRIAPGATAPFLAKVPAVPGVTTYRALVTSFRFVQSTESP